jgi:PadR family transcriptional regulator, regulatory protein PadR
MTKRRTNPDFLNGVPELLLLRLLSARAMYGYELVQAIRLATGGGLKFGEGCIYPLLHRLEADGMLTSRRETVGGRDRFVYRVTSRGRAQLTDRVTAWERVTAAVHVALHGTPHVKSDLA